MYLGQVFSEAGLLFLSSYSFPFFYLRTLPSSSSHPCRVGVSLSSLYWLDFSATGSHARVPSLVSNFPLERFFYPLPDSGVHEGLEHVEETAIQHTVELSTTGAPTAPPSTLRAFPSHPYLFPGSQLHTPTPANSQRC